RFLLGVRGPLVEIECDAEIPVQNVAGDVRDHRDGSTGYIDPVDRAGIEAIGQHRIAGAVVGILADPARTEDATIADLEQTPFEMIRHGSPPFVGYGCFPM